jgi:hypothetical protein
MQTFKNRYFTKRNYECRNIVACVAPSKPTLMQDCWVKADANILSGLTKLETVCENGEEVQLWGHG